MENFETNPNIFFKKHCMSDDHDDDDGTHIGQRRSS